MKLFLTKELRNYLDWQELALYQNKRKPKEVRDKLIQLAINRQIVSKRGSPTGKPPKS